MESVITVWQNKRGLVLKYTSCLGNKQNHDYKITTTRNSTSSYTFEKEKSKFNMLDK